VGAGFSVSVRRVSIVCFCEGAHRLLHDEHAPLRWRPAGGTRGGAASGAPPRCGRRPVSGTHCLGGARRPIGALRTVWRRQRPAAACGQGGGGGAWGGDAPPRRGYFWFTVDVAPREALASVCSKPTPALPAAADGSGVAGETPLCATASGITGGIGGGGAAGAGGAAVWAASVGARAHPRRLRRLYRGCVDKHRTALKI